MGRRWRTCLTDRASIQCHETLIDLAVNCNSQSLRVERLRLEKFLFYFAFFHGKSCILLQMNWIMKSRKEGGDFVLFKIKEWVEFWGVAGDEWIIGTSCDNISAHRVLLHGLLLRWRMCQNANLRLSLFSF